MKKKNQKQWIQKFRIPLPKQRNQAFKTKKDYSRKDKSWQDSRDFSFIQIFPLDLEKIKRYIIYRRGLSTFFQSKI